MASLYELQVLAKIKQMYQRVAQEPDQTGQDPAMFPQQPSYGRLQFIKDIDIQDSMPVKEEHESVHQYQVRLHDWAQQHPTIQQAVDVATNDVRAELFTKLKSIMYFTIKIQIILITNPCLIKLKDK